MTNAASAELIGLCQAQLNMLAQTLGASLSVVYVAESVLGSAQRSMVPIATYPANPVTLPRQQLPSAASASPATENPAKTSDTVLDQNTALDHQDAEPPAATPGRSTPESSVLDGPSLAARSPDSQALDVQPAGPDWFTNLASLPARFQETPVHRVALPLQQAGLMLGVLIVGREDRDWLPHEYQQLEATAQTLTLACLMDRRLHWLQAEYHQQELAQEAQQDLLDTLLHQIRNPLTAVRTFSKLLLRRLQPDAPEQQIARSIVRESDRLDGLLQQLDTAMTATTGTASLPAAANNPTIDTTAIRHEADVRPQDATPAINTPKSLPAQTTQPSAWTVQLAALETIDLAALLLPLLESAQTLAAEQDLALKIHWLSDCPSVQGNAQALQEVLDNLVSNALKYTPSGGAIAVTLTQESDWLVLSVSDSGPGIPDADQRQLFTRHFRGVQADGDIPGSGLGLAIAQELVQQMQGRLELISPAGPWHPLADQGSQTPGSVFQVWLPASPVASAGRTASNSRE
ncbi:MAG: ATP-binding protein [Cyanobacteria bacterium P01_H01_bin.121]